MAFRTGAYAKVWACQKGQGNYYVAEMSTSRKTQDGGYEKDWSNKFVRLVGNAAKRAENLSSGDNVKIGDCEVTNHFDNAKKTMYTNYVIFTFMDDDNNDRDTQKNAPKKVSKKNIDEELVTVPDGVDEELPFA